MLVASCLLLLLHVLQAAQHEREAPSERDDTEERGFEDIGFVRQIRADRLVFLWLIY
jgi:hypothetical protein